MVLFELEPEELLPELLRLPPPLLPLLRLPPPELPPELREGEEDPELALEL